MERFAEGRAAKNPAASLSLSSAPLRRKMSFDTPIEGFASVGKGLAFGARDAELTTKETTALRRSSEAGEIRPVSIFLT